MTTAESREIVLAMTGYPAARPPADLVIAQMCEHWHCLPSQVLSEDAESLMRIWYLSIEMSRVRGMSAKL